MFSEGRTIVEDEQRSGRPSTTQHEYKNLFDPIKDWRST